MNETARLATLGSLASGPGVGPGVGPVTAATAVAATDALPTQTGRGTPAAPLPAALPAAAAAPAPELSATAKLLSRLLSPAPDGLATGTAAPLRPLLATPDARPGQIAAALRQGIAHSGLFYESHLGEWFDGERALDTLRQEPQGRLMPASTGMDASAAAIVRQQLEMLDTQQLQWRGELCPGWPIALQLQKEAPPYPQDAPDKPETEANDETSTWHSTLVSTLPRLGEVTVRLSLAGDRLRLAMVAPSDANAALMSRHLPALDRALQRAGIALDASTLHAQRDA